MQLLLQRKDSFVSSKCLRHVIKFISLATQLENTMATLKPYVHRILFDTIIPIMFVTKKDVETFHEEPVEYIRNLYEFNETLYQAKN